MCRRKDVRAKRCPCDDPIPRRQRQNLAYAVATKGERDAREKERYERKALTVQEMLKEVPNAEEVQQHIASSPEVGREMATRIRSARENAESTEAWLLNGRENTPENLAAGMAERQQEVLAMGAVISERSQAIHGLDLDEEAENWKSRLAEAEGTLKELNDKREADSASYVEVRKGLSEKYGRLPYELRGHMSEEDEATFERYNSLAKQSAETYESQRKLTEEILQGRDPETLTVLKKVSDANLQAVKEVREIGGKVPSYRASIRSAHINELGETLQQTFPNDWVKASDEKGELVFARSTASSGRAHYQPVTEHPTPYTYRLEGTPDPRDSRFDGWVEDKDENGAGTGVWRGVKRDWLDEKNARNLTKFNGDKPKGSGWTRGTVPLRDGSYGTGWVRDNPTDAKRVAQAGSEAAEITVNTTDSLHDQKRATIHEFSHRVQDSVAHLPAMEKAYIAMRTTDENGVRHPLKAYGAGDRVYARRLTKNDEAVREDNWVTPYIGKEYDGVEMTELLSVGSESVFSGSYGGLEGIGHAKKDPETRNWILGAYATL